MTARSVKILQISGRRRGAGPVFRAIHDDVRRRLRSTLVPRVRQARDGSQYGGTQTTDISRINRRKYWLHLGADPGVCNDRKKRKSGLIGNASAQHLGPVDNRSHIRRQASAAAVYCHAGRRRLQAMLGNLFSHISKCILHRA